MSRVLLESESPPETGRTGPLSPAAQGSDPLPLVSPDRNTVPDAALKQQQKLLLQKHMDLVQRIARNYSHSVQSHFDDLVQVGSIGLLRAIERFDPARKTQFRTYAAHLITSEIRHYLRDQVAVIRLPRDLQELMPKLRQAEQALWQQLEREPEHEELAAYLGISSEKLTEVRQLESNHAPISLDQESSRQANGSTMTILEQLEDRRLRSFHLAQDDRIILQDSMDKIKGQSRQIIEFAFYQDLTQTEIAKQLGISQMQVSRRLKKAVGELWDTLNTRVTPW
ncbi:MAG: RNA polymerase subunit sigma [Candidatus Melainabacteria bacterium HGW-Melainabacteria-1]|nr:MAG: RNA polymerase subunit sigma [Candidatus Melainabacteria bacterium HGW-Melainabacteria-1]